MMSLPIRGTRWSIVLPCLIFLVPLFFFIFGMPFGNIASDAAEYVSYATHLLHGHGYTNGIGAFNNFREPGYPFFLYLIFLVFGEANYVAVYLIQTVILGILAVLVYKSFDEMGERRIGYIAGFITGLLPAYGLYAFRVGTELVFTFILALMFYLMIPIIRDHVQARWWRYIVIGIVAAIGTLIRAQLLFFPFFLAFFFLIIYRKKLRQLYRKIVVSLVIYAVVVGSWLVVVHAHVGTYAETSGRPEMALYIRAVRAQLSYKQLTEYAILWVRRSLTGGEGSAFLNDNEYQKLQKDYLAMATTSAEVAAWRSKDISIVRSHLGPYLYGNIIEVMKLEYVEHDFGDVLNKYIRAGMYLFVYGLFIIGVILLWRSRKETSSRAMASMSILAALYIIYNILILTPLDTIPRYNTPYLMLYIVIGLAGIVAFVRKNETSS